MSLLTKYVIEQKKRDRKMTSVVSAILSGNEAHMVVALSKLSDWHSVNEVKRIFKEVKGIGRPDKEENIERTEAKKDKLEEQKETESNKETG